MSLRWKEHYLKIVIVCSFLIEYSTPIASTCKPSDITQYNLTEEDLCNLCDEQCAKEHAYYGGDYEEDIRNSSSKGYLYSRIALHPPQDKKVCYFCIRYYNQSTKDYTLDGTLTIRKSPPIKNNSRKWTTKQYKQYDNGKIHVYSVITKSGKSFNLLQNFTCLF